MTKDEFRAAMAPIVARYHPRLTEEEQEALIEKLDWKCSAVVNHCNSRAKRRKNHQRLSVIDIRSLMVDEYGQECWVTGETIRGDNLQVDHYLPLTRNSETNAPANMVLLSTRGNRIKGELDPADLRILLAALDKMTDEGAKNILRRLATKPVFRK